MGIISAAAKTRVKYDATVDKVNDKIDSAKTWTKDKYATTKEFVSSPKEFVSNKYYDAKAKAVADAKAKADAKALSSSVNVASSNSIGGGTPPNYDNGPKGPSFWNRIGSGLSNIRLGNFFGGGGDRSHEEYGGLGFVFFLAIVAHIYDAITRFQRPGIMIYVYVFIFIIVFAGVYKLRIERGEAGLLFFIVLAFALPWSVDLLPNTKLATIASGMLFLLPVLVIYFGWKFPDNSQINKWTRRYMTFWVIVLFFLLIITLVPNSSTKIMVDDPLQGVKYVVSGVYKTFSTVFTSFGDSIKKSVNKIINPYEGEAESRVGIYLEDIRPLESRYNPNNEVYVEAKIKAENIKESVDVNTICYIDGLVYGNVSPIMIYGVTANYENIVGCNLGRLPPGIYTVKVRINFEFETTSDIAYTFVDSRMRSDQYDKLGIDSKTIATYTGGPVELGLPALTQPLRVDVEGNNPLSSYPFGVSLRNTGSEISWDQGKVVKGIRYMLDVPEEVELVDCSRNDVPPDPFDVELRPGRNIYLFEINNSNAGDTFDAVTCRMSFNDIDALLGSDLKSVKTFAAKAKYEYAIEGTTVVEVEKS